MTAFLIICAAMVAAVLLWLLVPLFRGKTAEGAASLRRERRIAGAIVALVVPAIAAGLYATLSKWDWSTVATQAAQGAEIDDMLNRLEEKLQANPQDVEGWLLLGRSFTATGRFARAIDAYERAYTLTKGENIDAVTGLGEALALTDRASLSGRAGQLFDEALAKAPAHPKALWYGSMAALQAGDLRTGRDRLQLLLAQNPPAELRGVLERQIQDLNQQLGEAGQSAATGSATVAQAAPSGGAQRAIRVSVSIAPEIRQQLGGPVPLFVLARDPQAGGPPLAVQRHSSADAPLSVELTERDAMIATRTIASVQKVLVVARLSKSGAPQAQSGDYFGEAEFDFTRDEDVLSIIIDRTVP